MKRKQPRKRKRSHSRRKRSVTSRKQKRKLDGFLNCYDFAYAGRDTVNQATKVSSGVIKAAANDINHIAEQRINQIIKECEKKVERVLPKILRGAIEDVYQTPFRLLGEFGKRRFNSIKKKILKLFICKIINNSNILYAINYDPIIVFPPNYLQNIHNQF